MAGNNYFKNLADYQNAREGDLKDYHCDLCKNKGYILKYNEEEDTIDSKECGCMLHRKNIRDIRKQGLSDLFESYQFKNFLTENDWQKKMKTKAEHYANNPKGWMYIGGQIGCVDCETEYFNGIEWKKISEYQQGEKVLQYSPQEKYQDGKAKLVEPIQYIKQPANSLWQIETDRGSIDQCLSLNHNFAYLTSKGNFNKKPFMEVLNTHNSTKQGFYGKVITTFKYDGKGIDLSDEQIRLMVAVIADGSFPSDKSKCSIRVKKKRKKERIETLLSDANVEYKKRDREEYSIYSFYAPRNEKQFSFYWYDCNHEQLKIVADEVLHWDGHVSGKRRTFSTTKKDSADFIQFVFSSTGHRATISEMNRIGDLHKSIEYTVIISNNNLVSLVKSSSQKKKATIKKVPTKDGYQYCFTVPSGNLVLRRNKRIFITGNSGKTILGVSTLNVLMSKGFRCKMVMWQTLMQELKTFVNEQEYFDILNDLDKIDFLMIDDLFKVGKTNTPTESDIRLTQIVLDRRYTKGLNTIITSEMFLDDVIDNISESIGSRIAERAKGNKIQSVLDKKRNYRLLKD